MLKFVETALAVGAIMSSIALVVELNVLYFETFGDYNALLATVLILSLFGIVVAEDLRSHKEYAKLQAEIEYALKNKASSKK